MLVPFGLFLLSLLGIAASRLPGLSNLLLIAAPAALAALILALRAWIRVRRQAPPRWIVIDGSNVMHWADGKPQLGTLRAVVDHLTALGFAPGVVFDANAGYKIAGGYRHDGALGKMLNLPADRVMVVPKGTQADPVLLAAARDLGARIVSNDRFRDWAEAHPEIAEPGRLIRGGFRDGKLWLDLD